MKFEQHWGGDRCAVASALACASTGEAEAVKLAEKSGVCRCSTCGNKFYNDNGPISLTISFERGSGRSRDVPEPMAFDTTWKAPLVSAIVAAAEASGVPSHKLALRTARASGFRRIRARDTALGLALNTDLELVAVLR
ncbi:uncharacterized protein AMSG_03406 [Thecamonas trahens ATCC 50062]|uniref:Uncharacterized protein n=1 Tax=Thecamonas trahens ATCC 50062 TaxID=461836 RepID=A0A0L0D6P1_THETB|nr:hypothetical protein AMSG_03406 [Thecamonas trahens ATCC 50062]KNC46973.1 hypothetical protein AMSG_03406 [Thecamonas trahens ATCC 50062]|eukprot:XP_013760244.1 hypothetical protein AMSG_03406 [Thecamonas trahens ATCC 50062]